MKVLYSMIYIYIYISAQLLTAQTLVWHKEHNGPGADLFENITDVIMDDDFNVYVTGKTSEGIGIDDYSIRTIKYDKTGERKWISMPYNAGYGAEARSICLDEAGNVYVAGFRYAVNNACCLAVLKYDGATSEILATNCDMLQDPHFYNGWKIAHWDQYVYIASMRDNNCWLVKLNDDDLSFVWQRQYSLYDYNWWNDMIIDAAGNIYVTGMARTGYYHTITAKYDQNGNTIWGPVVYDYDSRGMAIDLSGDGHVCVTGRSSRDANYGHAMVLKYNGNSGDLMWYYRDFITETSSAVRDIAICPFTGEISITGWIFVNHPNNYDVLTITLDNDGNELWCQQYGGSDTDDGFEVAVTNLCVYVSGFATVTDRNILTLCYALHTGGLLWSQTYDYGNGSTDESWNTAVKGSATYTYVISCGYKSVPHEWATLMYRYLEIGQHPPGNDIPLDMAMSVQVYPNPAKGKIKLRFETIEKQPLTIRLYNATGEFVATIYDGATTIGTNVFEYKHPQLPNGIYFVQVDCRLPEQVGFRRYTEKVVYHAPNKY